MTAMGMMLPNEKKTRDFTLKDKQLADACGGASTQHPNYNGQHDAGLINATFGTKMTSDNPAQLIDEPAEYAIDTWSDFRDAVLRTIELTRSTLLLFDSDLSQTGLESAAGVERLTALLLRSAHADAIRVLVRDARHLERNCPRLLGLLTRFGHRISVKVASAHMAIPESAFLIADNAHLLIRFHHERPRGKRCIADTHSASECSAQFETLWMNAETGPNGAPIGL